MRSRSALLFAAAALAAATVAPAADAAPRAYGAATVVSVDGPTSLTIENRKGQRIPLRLIGIDAPRAGECGAAETQAALQGIVGRKLRDLRYSLRFATRKDLERDADGRYVGSLTYYRPRDYDDSEVAARLVDAGWARSGLPATLDSPTPRHLWTAVEADEDPGALRDRQGRPVGVWARCGGRLHAPADQPVPATAAVPWTTTDRGITTAIGGVKLPSVMSPEATLTLRGLAAAAPDLEIVRWENACVGFVPSLQLVAYTWTTDQPASRCGDSDVQAITTFGPGNASVDRGPKVGDRPATVRSAYPLVDDLALDSDTDSIPLSGAEFHAWAWQTHAQLDDRGRIAWFTTYAVAPVFE